MKRFLSNFRKPYFAPAVFSSLAVAFAFYLFSDVTWAFSNFLFVAFLPHILGLWALAWFTRLIVFVIRIRSRRKWNCKECVVRWSIEPVVALVLYGLVATNSLFHLRFFASIPFLKHEVQEQLDSFDGEPLHIQYQEWTDQVLAPFFLPNDQEIEQRNPDDVFKVIGLFRIRSTQVLRSDCVLFETVFGGRDSAGVLYFTGEGTPPTAPESVYYHQHISGPWWKWEHDM